MTLERAALLGILLVVGPAFGAAAAALAETSFASQARILRDVAATGTDGFGTGLAADASLALIGIPRAADGRGRAWLVDLAAAGPGQVLGPRPDDVPAHFGFSVVLATDHVLVGAPGRDVGDGVVGAVHQFDRAGRLERVIADPEQLPGTRFGAALAVQDGNLYVGAPLHPVAGRPVGRVYRIDLASGAVLERCDDPTPTDHDLFGSAMAVNAARLVIGAPGDAGNERVSGQVHVYSHDRCTLLRTIDDPTPTRLDSFGAALGLMGNGENAVVAVGAPRDDSGAQLGGEVHLFGLDGSLVTLNDPSPTGGERFGAQLAVLDDDRIAVAAPGHDEGSAIDAGALELFDRGGEWLATLRPQTVYPGMGLGTAVVASADWILAAARSRQLAAEGDLVLVFLVPPRRTRTGLRD